MSSAHGAYDETACRLALHRAAGIGVRTFHKLLGALGSAGAVLRAGRASWRGLGLSDAAIAALESPDWVAVESDLRWATGEHCHILAWGQQAYPPLLCELPDPPPILYVRGDPRLLSLPQLAMVGSRNPTATGRDTARAFAAELVRRGLAVTSGLAMGIDAACHEGALQAAGVTVAVTGTGPDRIYPARNRGLALRIAEAGAVVTELPPGTPVKPGNFPRRNRIISGLSLGVLVMEASIHSGSLITGRAGAEQGREVFAVPGSIHNPLARGCHALIREGAKLVETVEHVIEELGPIAGAARAAAASSVAELAPGAHLDLDADYRALLGAMAFDPQTVDTLVQRSGLTAEAVSSMLLILELQGLVASAAGGRYCRTAMAPAVADNVPGS